MNSLQTWQDELAREAIATGADIPHAWRIEYDDGGDGCTPSGWYATGLNQAGLPISFPTRHEYGPFSTQAEAEACSHQICRPEKFRIAESFRPLLTSLLTSTTCGEACWHAREPICRCECGGKNHGCLRTGDGSRPTRAAKIAGASYELAAVGTYANLAPLACNMNESRGWSMIDARAPEYRYHYTHKDTDPGAPARLRPASADQCARWEELAAWKGTRERPYLLWKRRDEPAGLFTYCPDDCARCAQHRATWAEEITASQPQPEPAPTPAPPAAGALTQLAFLL